MEAHFLGGPHDGTTQEMPSPLPSAWNVAELVEIDEWTAPHYGTAPRERITTYLRRSVEFAGRRYAVYVAPGWSLDGWRPTTHRCTACGASVRVHLIPTTTHEDDREDRRTAIWGKAEPCGACGSTVRPDRVDGWDDVVTWTVERRRG